MVVFEFNGFQIRCSGTLSSWICLVYARHGHELIGLKFLVREFIMCNITEVLAKGKCGSVRSRAEEACSKIMSRRTETSYKAKPLDKLARHSKVRNYIREGYKTAVDIDLSKFFDRVNHDILMERVARRIKDKRVLRLIGKYLRAGVVVNGRLQRTKEGVPQGGPLSPLLANIVLDDLDNELEKREHKFARYADDFTILVKSEQAGERVLKSITRFLEKKLKLKVNEKKSHVGPTGKSSFLGFTFKGKQIRWTDKAFNEFKRRVKKYTGRSWGVSMSYRMKKLTEYIRGWMGYYGISEYYRPIPELDEWLRRRIRMCYWKQWKHYRKRIGSLIKLGAPVRDAINAGLSRKSHWRLSRTMATHMAMTNEWLADQGLISIKEKWISIHYPATAR